MEIIKSETLHTPFGNARINSDGYYQITSRKENNHSKILHRLLWENFYGCEIPKGFIIHHKNGIKTDNCILNLQLMKENKHNQMHNIGRQHTNKSKQKMSKAKLGENHHYYGKQFSEQHKNKISKGISKTKNKSGYYRVYKQKALDCKQGFQWCYAYRENNKTKRIKSVDIKKLEQKVKAKGLEWIKFED